MSVYAGDKIQPLQEAIASLFNQALPPSEVVIVADGPIPAKLDAILIAASKQYPQIRLDYLSVNIGRGRARNAAIELVHHEHVFIMDSDDRALPNRFQLLMQAFVTDPELGFVCGWAREFDDHSNATLSIKRCPEADTDIRKAIRFTNVICNPTCGFRKEWWKRVGGFPDFREINEDHLFYLRLGKAGCKFKSLPTTVLDFRMTPALYTRRRGWKVFKADIAFRMSCVSEGHNNPAEAAVYLLAFAARRFAPAGGGAALQRLWRRLGR